MPGRPGLFKDWTAFFGEGAQELEREEPGLQHMLGEVVTALAQLPEGQRLDSRWPPEFTAYVAAYHDEVAFMHRELRFRVDPPAGG